MQISILGNKVRVEIIILCMLIGAFIACNVWCTCAGGVKEGFSALTGSALNYNMGEGVKGSWMNQPDKYNIYQKLEANKIGAVPPLAGDRLDMFYENVSSPGCCPSTYTTSTGCVCETKEQAMYLNTRGGNRTFTTNY